jgi:prophage tail gpP-like protein
MPTPASSSPATRDVPTSSNDRVSVLIGGHMHDDWTSYDIDSDLLTPADAWRVELTNPNGKLPSEVITGAPIEVRLDNDIILSGRLGEIDEDVSKGRDNLMLSGRDNASILVDCAAPIFVAKQVTLQQVMANVVNPFGITKIRVDAAATYTSEKINVEPGDTAWHVLQNVAEANGLWPWFDPDGTLVVGGPDYTTPPVASLVMRLDGRGNNVESLRHIRSMEERYSQVTVLGQTHGTSSQDGRNAIKATATDSSVSFFRPQIVVDHECDSAATALSRARKLLMDSRLKSMTLTARVRGHRTSDGVLWKPGQRVHVMSEKHDIDAIFFLMGRRFSKGRGGMGTVTILTLKEDGIWTLDAHPHQRRHRRGKNQTPDEILNVEQG